MKESWGKQHAARIPWRIKFLCFAGAAEKMDQTWLMPCWSDWERLLSSYYNKSVVRYEYQGQEHEHSVAAP
jgi:hypothetical protein